MTLGELFGPSITSEPDVISADLIIIGDQVGCSCFSKAATPATCGVAIDVPLKRLKSRFPCAGVCATAARTSWPGAITSGFKRSPRPANCGPREENVAVNGAGTFRTIVDWLILAVGFVVAE